MHPRLRLWSPLLLLCLAAGCQSPEPTQTASVPATPPGATTGNATPAAPASGDKPIVIGYSDWPGWTAWDVVDQKGFFKKHGVTVQLKWFPNYSDSLNAFAAGQVDANCQTWSDTMGPIAQGQKLKVVLVNDNSFGNDAMITQPGIASVKALKGKKVATELGTCDHFLLLKALQANGMTEKEIQYVNLKVQDCPAAMLSKAIDAAVVWEPSRSKILKDLKGSKSVYDSAKIPGLIPDLLVVQGAVAESRKADLQKVVDAWYDMLDWWKTHPDEAVKIMAKRTDSTVDFYKGFIKGTRIFSSVEALKALTPGPDVTSLQTSGAQIGKFLLAAKQVPKMPDYAAVIDNSYTKKSLDQKLGMTPPYEYHVAMAKAG